MTASIFELLDARDISDTFEGPHGGELFHVAHEKSRANGAFMYKHDPEFTSSMRWIDSGVSRAMVERRKKIHVPYYFKATDVFTIGAPLFDDTFNFRHLGTEAWIDADKKLMQEPFEMLSMSTILKGFESPWLGRIRDSKCNDECREVEHVVESMFDGDKDGLSVILSRKKNMLWDVYPALRKKVIKHLATKRDPDPVKDASFIDAMKSIADTTPEPKELKPLVNVKNPDVVTRVARSIMRHAMNHDKLQLADVKRFWKSNNPHARGAIARAIVQDRGYGYISCDALLYLRGDPAKRKNEYFQRFNAEIKHEHELRCKPGKGNEPASKKELSL